MSKADPVPSRDDDGGEPDQLSARSLAVVEAAGATRDASRAMLGLTLADLRQMPADLRESLLTLVAGVLVERAGIALGRAETLHEHLVVATGK